MCPDVDSFQKKCRITLKSKSVDPKSANQHGQFDSVGLVQLCLSVAYTLTIVTIDCCYTAAVIWALIWGPLRPIIHTVDQGSYSYLGRSKQ